MYYVCHIGQQISSPDKQDLVWRYVLSYDNILHQVGSLNFSMEISKDWCLVTANVPENWSSMVCNR